MSPCLRGSFFVLTDTECAQPPPAQKLWQPLPCTEATFDRVCDYEGSHSARIRNRTSFDFKGQTEAEKRKLFTVSGGDRSPQAKLRGGDQGQGKNIKAGWMDCRRFTFLYL